MTFLLKLIGSIRVDRESHDFAFLNKSCDILEKGGVVEIYPEARIPVEGEETPLPFKTSTVYLALMSGAPIVPVYHNGKFLSKERTCVMVGKPIYIAELYDESLSEKENLVKLTEYLRQKVIDLKYELERKTTKKTK